MPVPDYMRRDEGIPPYGYPMLITKKGECEMSENFLFVCLIVGFAILGFIVGFCLKEAVGISEKQKRYQEGKKDGKALSQEIIIRQLDLIEKMRHEMNSVLSLNKELLRYISSFKVLYTENFVRMPDGPFIEIPPLYQHSIYIEGKRLARYTHYTDRRQFENEYAIYVQRLAELEYVTKYLHAKEFQKMKETESIRNENQSS